MNKFLGWNKLSLTKKEAIFGYLFILPWLIGFLGLRLGPMLASFFLSFSDYAIISAPEFIGLANFIKMFTNDPSFWDALRVTVTYAVFAIPIGMAISLTIALLLNQKVPGVAVWRTIYYLPSVVSGVALATLWVWLFHSQFGLINLGLGVVGIKGPAWLANPDWALVALIIMSFWGIDPPCC